MSFRTKKVHLILSTMSGKVLIFYNASLL